MKWRHKSLFERDFKLAIERFPKLNTDFDSRVKSWVITGELDICDRVGDYWGTFKIRMFVPNNYPHCIPKVQELSNLIPREEDWHIDRSGFCCLDIDHRLILMARKGINLISFIEQKVYSFFANQLYKHQHNMYAGDEYKHGFDGVIQFYYEDLNLTSEKAALFLEKILQGDAKRNTICPCGSNLKMKYCHLSTFTFLKNMGVNRLIFDLGEFQRHLRVSGHQPSSLLQLSANVNH